MAAWNKLDGAKALVESGISSVPDFYVKPAEERQLFSDLILQKEEEDLIPVIDLSRLLDPSSDLDEQAVIRELIDASERWGFFQVINHGVDTRLTEQMLDVAHEFFELPLSEKMVYYGTDIEAAVRYGTSFNPLKEQYLDWCDNLLHRFLPRRQDQPHPWPTKPTSYRKVSEEYLDRVKFLAQQLLKALSQGLGLEPKYQEEGFGKHQAFFRLNYYPCCPNPELAMGLSSHSDVGGLTILLQDKDVVGLQVKFQETWKTVKPVSGALVVNIGDQLQILSNGKLKSVEHRAIVNARSDRVSVALFLDPAPDVRVAPIPKLLDAHHPALYRPCLYEEYVKNLFSKKLVGKAWVESQKQS